MSIITSVNIDYLIEKSFNPDLLFTTLERVKKRLETKIKPLAEKKLREKDVGKRRQFIMYLIQFEELYERKTQEEADYQAKIEEENKKRPRIPNSSGTIRFKRL